MRIVLRRIHAGLALESFVCCGCAVLLFAVFSKAQRPGPGGPSNRPAPVQRILLLSIDGMHNLDLERLVRERP
ncbi:MAG TPA: hypothetical protein VJN92_16225, partial [Candidatus Acidoferrum sp.]|nr:hypothetical protein [Candidatus Acidoferrum sp.]